MNTPRQKRFANRLRHRVEAVIQSDEKNRRLSLGSLLYGMSLFYGAGVAARDLTHRLGLLSLKRLPCPVISVGNLTVGGAGKTPTAIYVTQLLQRLGRKPAVVARGYRGNAEKLGGVASDGEKMLMGPDAAGDEAFMMAKRLGGVPVVVGQDRFRAGTLAVNRFDSNAIVLDDGYQHIRLERDINLALLDHRRPFGNGFLLPRGALREPRPALRRADALILTRCDQGGPDPSEVLNRYCPNLPVFKSVHKPYLFRSEPGLAPVFPENPKGSNRKNLGALKGRRVFCFSGIADNGHFRTTVEGFSCNICGFSGFSDHHPYSKDDLNRIARAANETHAEVILTTEKDDARIPRSFSWPVDLVVIGVNIAFDDGGKAFDAFIDSRLTALCNEKVPLDRCQRRNLV